VRSRILTTRILSQKTDSTNWISAENDKWQYIAAPTCKKIIGACSKNPNLFTDSSLVDGS
jgi:hypothetical protein